MHVARGVFLALIASAALSAQEQQQTVSPDFSEVRSLIQQRVASGVPSIAIAVAQHGRIVWEEAFGVSDRERNTSATVHTPYYLASISKTITATALMGLVERHKVNLDRPVNDYLHTAKLTSPMWDVSKATVRRVANHTAGLATFDRDCFATDHDCDPSATTAIRRYGVVVWPPGDQFDYSNLDYGILGEVVARASHASLDSTLQQTVFSPLGMSNCFLDANSAQMKSAAIRYDSTPPLSPTPPKHSSTPGASSIYCSVHDLALFGMLHLKDHLASQKGILSDSSLDQMQAPSISAKEESQYGLSWWVQDNLNGFHGVLAQGGTNDATAYLQLIPSEDMAGAMLWNTGTPDGGKIIDQILAALIPQYRKNLETAPASNPPAASTLPPGPSSDMIGAWSGFVQTYKGKVPLTLNVDGSGSLVAKLGSQPVVARAHPRFGEGVLRWTMPGALGVEGEPFDLAMRLYLHNGVLAGAARAGPTTANKNGIWVYYWVQLEKR